MMWLSYSHTYLYFAVLDKTYKIIIITFLDINLQILYVTVGRNIPLKEKMFSYITSSPEEKEIIRISYISLAITLFLCAVVIMMSWQ